MVDYMFPQKDELTSNYTIINVLYSPKTPM